MLPCFEHLLVALALVEGVRSPYSNDRIMSTPANLPACPQCTLENTYSDGANYVCPDCGHEWPMSPAAQAGEEAGRVIKDANGNPLADGDTVILIKDLKVKGSSIVLKKGTKIKGIRLPGGAGDHEVDCKTDQGAFMLKAEFMKKA